MSKPRSGRANQPVKRQPGSGGARKRAEEQRRRQARQRTTIRLAVAGVVLAVLAVLVIANLGGDDGGGSSAVEPAGVQRFGDLARNHVQTPVEYPQTPPVGGDHAPVWQNCGVYPQPITTGLGVHAMEHGAVWITYRADLPAAEVAKLTAAASGQPYVLVSPWADELPAPVVASAWGRQLRLESASDPRLTQFVRAFEQGPQTPEPGAPCTGGQAGM